MKDVRQPAMLPIVFLMYCYDITNSYITNRNTLMFKVKTLLSKCSLNAIYAFFVYYFSVINMKEDSVIIVLKMATRSPNFGGKNSASFFSQKVCQRIT